MTIKGTYIPDCSGTAPGCSQDAATELRLQLISAETLLHEIQGFARDNARQGGSVDPNMLAVYATISKYMFGDTYAPGGNLDQYLIP